MSPINYIGYVRILSLVFAGLFVLNLIFSLTLDPYKIFGVIDFNVRNFEPNTRYAKIEFLKKNKFEGYILGNSRVNGYDVKLATQLTGNAFYNLTAGSESPFGMHKKIQWLLKNQPVKQLILALDFEEFEQPLDRNDNELSSQEHPDISGMSRFLFYWKYLWVHPYIHAVSFYGNAVKKDTWYKFDLTTGHYYFPLFDRMMANSPEKYIQQRFNTKWAEKIFRVNPAQLSYLRKVIALARDCGVDVMVFVNPVNHWQFKRYERQVYAEWLASIVHIAGQVWDFSGLNSITTNDRLYYEHSHFTFRVGRLALMRVFDPGSADLGKHPDFGVLVTHENIGKQHAQVVQDSARTDASPTRASSREHGTRDLAKGY